MSEDMRWYAVKVLVGSEAQVVKNITQAIERENLGDRFGEILVPTEEVVDIREGRKRRTERKHFPGYVLIHMEMSDETWHIVRHAPRVTGFIGGDKPTPLTEKEVQSILALVTDAVDKPKPKTLFEPGESVRIKEGPFADFNGVVEEVNYEKSMLRVAVLIFGRSTPVELDFSQVEKG